MDCIYPRIHRDADDVVNIEIGGDGLLAHTHQITLVGLETVQREAVFVGVDRHRADAHLGSSAHHTDADFATIGDQQLLDREGHLTFLNLGAAGRSAALQYGARDTLILGTSLVAVESGRGNQPGTEAALQSGTNAGNYRSSPLDMRLSSARAAAK
ncbi:MAG: hypothetical protein V4650_00360 [Pseudomonadota bacterium]